jgi:hypothetical protein
MDSTTLIRDDEPAAPVRWEPCAAPDEDGPVCEACGWPVQDHAAAAAARRAA